jgi:hypothetical protein
MKKDASRSGRCIMAPVIIDPHQCTSDGGFRSRRSRRKDRELGRPAVAYSRGGQPLLNTVKTSSPWLGLRGLLADKQAQPVVWGLFPVLVNTEPGLHHQPTDARGRLLYALDHSMQPSDESGQQSGHRRLNPQRDYESATGHEYTGRFENGLRVEDELRGEGGHHAVEPRVLNRKAHCSRVHQWNTHAG